MKVNIVKALCGILVLVLVVMGYGTAHLLARVKQLDRNQEEMAAKIFDLSENLAELQAAGDLQGNNIRTIEQRVEVLQTPPGPAELAAEILAAKETELVEEISKRLSGDPGYSAALRGEPGQAADNDEIADSVFSDLESSPPFARSVGAEIWAIRQREIVSQPQLIATVASEVYEIYGEDLRNGISAGISAERIAELLSDSLKFAELVAFMSD